MDPVERVERVKQFEREAEIEAEETEDQEQCWADINRSKIHSLRRFLKYDPEFTKYFDVGSICNFSFPIVSNQSSLPIRQVMVILDLAQSTTCIYQENQFMGTYCQGQEVKDFLLRLYGFSK